MYRIVPLSFCEYNNNVKDISKEEYLKIYNGDVSDFAFSQDPVRRSYYLEIRNNLLEPKVIVDYYREAFILPYNEIRLTFDTQLAAAKPCLNIFTDRVNAIPLPKYYSLILEVKYNNFLPTHIKAILERYNLTRLSVSKFLICRDKIQ